jgi:hypothetical protein
MVAYPLQLTFKLIAISPQISATDANGQLVFYVRQKAFKLKEKVTVFADTEQTRPIYTMGADRILDWSAEYVIATVEGGQLGSVKRQGMRSLWKAHYDILRGGAAVMSIQEENAWVKLIDGVVGEIPVLGILSSYLFHPAYLVSRIDGPTLLRVQKQPALWEGRYEVTRPGEISGTEEELALLAILMVVLLERTRG